MPGASPYLCHRLNKKTFKPMKTTLMILSMVWHMMHSLLFRQRMPQSRNTRSVTHSQGETQTCPKHPQADKLTDSPASPGQAAPTAQTTPTVLTEGY